MAQQTPKLYAITYERFPQPGGDGYLDTELRVFDSKRAAERYAQKTVIQDNDDYQDMPFVTFKDVRLIRKIDGYRVELGYSRQTRRVSKTLRV